VVLQWEEKKTLAIERNGGGSPGEHQVRDVKEIKRGGESGTRKYTWKGLLEGFETVLKRRTRFGGKTEN